VTTLPTSVDDNEKEYSCDADVLHTRTSSDGLIAKQVIICCCDFAGSTLHRSWGIYNN